MGLFTAGSAMLPIPGTGAEGHTSARIAGEGGEMAGRGQNRGVGFITSSNFFVPQANLPASMAAFVLPAAVPVPLAVKSGKTGV